MRVLSNRNMSKATTIDSRLKSKNIESAEDNLSSQIAEICLNCPTLNKKCRGYCDYFKSKKSKILGKKDNGSMSEKKHPKK